MRELSTIQKREKLNRVFAVDEPGAGGAHHLYMISSDKDRTEQVIQFQNGPKNSENSISGVLDVDLLEIVRDRLQGFQSSQYRCGENACALMHIEESLMWLNKRVEDRIERNVLGTDHK